MTAGAIIWFAAWALWAVLLGLLDHRRRQGQTQGLSLGYGVLTALLGAIIGMAVTAMAWKDSSDNERAYTIIGLVVFAAAVAYVFLRTLGRRSLHAAAFGGWLNSIVTGCAILATLFPMALLLILLPVATALVMTILVRIPWAALAGAVVSFFGMIPATVEFTVSARRGDQETAPEESETMPQQRAMVISMLAEGKVSAAQAEELIAALGKDARRADDIPTQGLGASLIGTLLVVVGFGLPWFSSTTTFMGQQWASSQSGYHLGILGWLILIIGVIPALLVCVPALDRHLRQGHMRLLFSASGVAFMLPLLLASVRSHAWPTWGLLAVSAGFLIQMTSGVRQGILRKG